MSPCFRVCKTIPPPPVVFTRYNIIGRSNSTRGQFVVLDRCRLTSRVLSSADGNQRVGQQSHQWRGVHGPGTDQVAYRSAPSGPVQSAHCDNHRRRCVFNAHRCKCTISWSRRDSQCVSLGRLWASVLCAHIHAHRVCFTVNNSDTTEKETRQAAAFADTFLFVWRQRGRRLGFRSVTAWRRHSDDSGGQILFVNMILTVNRIVL